jgi:hypothetical protein
MVLPQNVESIDSAIITHAPPTDHFVFYYLAYYSYYHFNAGLRPNTEKYAN